MALSYTANKKQTPGMAGAYLGSGVMQGGQQGRARSAYKPLGRTAGGVNSVGSQPRPSEFGGIRNSPTPPRPSEFGGIHAAPSSVGLPTSAAGYAGPGGFFHAGNGGYGYVNAHGAVAYGVHPSATARYVSNPFQGVGAQPAPGTAPAGVAPGAATDPGVPTPYSYLNDAYFSSLAGLNQGLQTDLNGYNAQLAGIDGAIDPVTGLNAHQLQTKQLADSYAQKAQAQRYQMANSGLLYSGARNQADLGLAQSQQSASDSLDQGYASKAQTLQQQIADRQSQYNDQLASLNLTTANDAASHDAAPIAGPTPGAAPVPKGFFQVGKNWYFRNAQGVIAAAKTPGVHASRITAPTGFKPQ